MSRVIASLRVLRESVPFMRDRRAHAWQALLPHRGRPVVVLSASRDGLEVAQWRQRFPDCRIEVVSPADPPPWDWANVDPHARPDGPVTQVSAAIRQLGVLDAIVDLLPPAQLPGEARNRTQLFRLLFGYIGVGGVYLVDREAVDDEAGTRMLVRQLASVQVAGSGEKRSSRPDRELRVAIKALHVAPGVVVVSKRVRHFVKLRDLETDEVLPQREPGMRLTCLAELPAGRFESRATVSSHGVRDRALPATFDYPELHVRQYDGDITLAGRTLMFSGSTVLPDSFRHPLAPGLKHPALRAGNSIATRIPRRFEPKHVLDGPYYQLDSLFGGHFGHVMTELVSRLWGWDLAREQHPNLRAIMFRPAGRPLRADLQLRLVRAFGIKEDEIVWSDEPVAVRSVVSASPMWHGGQPLYVHPGLERVWRRLTADLLLEAPDIDTPERVFVSRGAEHGHRTCRNRREVEDLFVRHGFQVIYPEKHSLAEQALVFSHASHIAGLGGSGMFNLMHCRKLRSVVILNHDAYTSRNEHLFTALTGGDVHYFWSRSEKAQPESGWSGAAFMSPWTFDFAQHGARLEELLDSF